MHTPALYSAFLRALLSNKMNPPASDPAPVQPDHHQQTGDPSISVIPVQQDGMMQNGHVHHAQVAPPAPDAMQYGGYPTQFGSYPEFQFAGEMGPVADMSTFPPTMAPMPAPPPDDMSHALFATGFWDNVLVPGLLFSPPSATTARLQHLNYRIR
jgi:hypothetical protein